MLKMAGSIVITAAAAGVPGVLPAAHALAQSAEPQYAIIELQALGGGVSQGNCINAYGQIGGYSTTSGEQAIHALLWNSGESRDLGTLGGLDSFAFDINDFAVVVGQAMFSYDPPLTDNACLWTAEGVPLYLGTLGGDESTAKGINNAGVVVGEAEQTPGGSRHGFRWQDGVMTPLAELDGSIGSRTYDINEGGYAVGLTVFNPAWHGTLWSPDGTVEDLGAFYGSGTHLYAINDSLEIAGYASYISGCAIYYNYLTDELINLQEGVFEFYSAAYDINNMGQVVGLRIDEYSMKEEAFVWDREHGMVILNRLKPPNCDWRLRFASGINDFGQITGSGSRTGDGYWDNSGYLMTPVYPSFDLTYARPGRADEVNTIRATNFVNVPVGTTVYFCYSFRGGGSLIPGCDVSVNALQIDNAKVAGTAEVGENGVAKLVCKIPPSMHGRQVIFQAYIPGSCEISNLVVQTFE